MLSEDEQRPKPTRRDFLAMGVAAAATVPLASIGPFATASSHGSFTTALQTYSLKELHLHYLLPVVRGLGFSRVELYDRQLSPFSSPRDLESALVDIRTNRIEVVAFYSDLFSADELETHTLFGFGAKLGIDVLSSGQPPEALAVADRLVPSYGIDVAIHNTSPDPDSAYVTLNDVRSALDSMPNLTACVDVGNFFRSGVDPAEAIRVIGDRVREIHIKDVDANGEHTLLGDGEMDLPSIVQALKDVGYSGPVTLEFGGQPYDIARRIESIAENGRRLARLVGA